MYRRQRIYFDQKSAVYRVDHNGLLENKHRSIFISQNAHAGSKSIVM